MVFVPDGERSTEFLRVRRFDARAGDLLCERQLRVKVEEGFDAGEEQLKGENVSRSYTVATLNWNCSNFVRELENKGLLLKPSSASSFVRRRILSPFHRFIVRRSK